MANKTMHHLVIEDNNYEILDAKNRANIAAEYSASSTYNVGDVVLYNGQLYKCTTAITTAEAWTAAHWTAVTVGEKVADLEATTNDLKEDIGVVVESRPGVNLFDGNFDQSGYIDSNGADAASSNFKRTSKYYPIVGDVIGYMYYFTTVSVAPFAVAFYNANKTFTHMESYNNLTQGYRAITANDKYFRVYTAAAFNGNVTLSLTSQSSYIPYEMLQTVKDGIIGVNNFDDEVKDILNIKTPTLYINGIPSDVLAEFYLLDNTYTPYGVYTLANEFDMKLKDGNGNVRTNASAVPAKYYSDKIQRFVDTATGKIVAYYILHYTGTDFATDSNALTFTSSATNLDDSGIIKTYLNRGENLVLIGDSLFGYPTYNVLEAILSTISDKQVFNCGFGGCTMALRNLTDYDVFSFSSVIDSIVDDDYSDMRANMSINQAYPYRIASLDSVDWSKPTTIFINYVNNDITASVPIGDQWDYTDAITDFDKNTVLGAFNYGIKTLLTEYPHINVVQFTSAWRKLGINNVPPYAYTNTLNLSPNDYDTAIKTNADRQGVSIYDYFKYGGRNWYNASYYQQDETHYNANGFALFAKILNALDQSFID